MTAPTTSPEACGRRHRRFGFWRSLLAALLLTVTAEAPVRANQNTPPGYEDSLLKTAITLSKEHQYEKSFDMLNKLKTAAELGDDSEMLYRYHLNWGVNLAVMYAYDDALRSFMSAYKIAVDELDVKHETGVLNNIAGIFMLMGNNLKANEYYKKNYRIATEINDSALIAGSAMNIALTALNLGNPKECLDYMRRAEPLVKADSPEWNVYLLLKLTYLIFNGNYSETIALADKELKQALPHEVRRNVRCKLSTAYIATGQYKNATDTLAKAIAEESDIVDKIPLYELMQQARHKSNDFDGALRYYDSLAVAKDSLQSRRDRSANESNSIIIDLLRKDKEMAEIRARQTRNNVIIGFSILVLILLLAGYASHSRRRHRAARQELMLSKQNEELLKSRLLKSQAETLLRQKELQLEIEMKNRELMSKACSWPTRTILSRKSSTA